MGYSGIANNYNGFLEVLRNYIVGHRILTKNLFDPTSGFTFSDSTTDANVYIYFNNDSLTVGEYTLTCTTAGADGTAVFELTNPSDTDLGDVTSGTRFESTDIDILLTVVEDFAVDDTITFTVEATNLSSANNEIWDSDSFVKNTADSNGDFVTTFFCHGNGSGGSEEINIGFETEHDEVNNIYNLKINSFADYDSGDDFEDQSGASPTVYLTLEDAPVQYWLRVSGNVVCGAVKVGVSNYHSFYAGYINRFSSDRNHPRPILVGANAGSNISAETSNNAIRSWWSGYRNSTLYASAYFLSANGNWLFISATSSLTQSPLVDEYQCGMFPYTNGDTVSLSNSGLTSVLLKVTQDHNGNSFVMPIMLLNFEENGIMGEPYFFKFIAGSGVNSEDDITIGTAENIVIGNRSSTGAMDYCLLELDS